MIVEWKLAKTHVTIARTDSSIEEYINPPNQTQRQFIIERQEWTPTPFDDVDMHLCQSLVFSHFVCVQHTGRPSTLPEFFDHKLNLTILEVPLAKNIDDYTFDRLWKNLGDNWFQEKLLRFGPVLDQSSVRGRGGLWRAKLVPVNTKQQQIHFHHCQIMTTIFIGEYQITLWSMFLTCHFPFKGSLLNDPKIWFECCLEISSVHQSSSVVVGPFRWVLILLCYSIDAASMWTNLKSTPQVAGIYRDSQKAICASNFMNLLTNVILLFKNECWLEKRKPPCK